MYTDFFPIGVCDLHLSGFLLGKTVETMEYCKTAFLYIDFDGISKIIFLSLTSLKTTI